MTKRRKQCAKCPWKVGVDPHDIPNGYCEIGHRNLKSTIADPETSKVAGGLRLMACHETPPGRELPCVGWLVNQIGPGGNLPLRLAIITGQVDGRVETVGPQHETFEDTLPRNEP